MQNSSKLEVDFAFRFLLFMILPTHFECGRFSLALFWFLIEAGLWGSGGPLSVEAGF
jgi:hypothetical protein